jgi:hypothetical protein
LQFKTTEMWSRKKWTRRVAGSCEQGNETLASIKMLGMSWLAEEVLAS